MSKHVVGSQKFANLEILDSAKFDNEIVFEDLSMVGESLNIICSEDITLSSTGTSSPWGVSVLSVGPVHISSSQSTNWITAGFNDGIAPTSGTVGIGHSTGGAPIAGLLVEFESTSGEVRLSAFGKTPVAQPTTASASAAFVHNGGSSVSVNDTFGGYTLGQVVQALKDIGLLA